MAKTVTLDISIDPVDMEIDGDILSESAVLARIRDVATGTWPEATIKFKTLQVGYSQGDGWARGWIDHVRDDAAVTAMLLSIDWTDEDLYQ